MQPEIERAAGGSNSTGPSTTRAWRATVPDDVDRNASANSSYRRARLINASLGRAPLSDEALWDALEDARADGTTDDPQLPGPPTRTLWHAQYDIDARAVAVEFYLGDNDDGSPRRSERVTFGLTSS